MSNVVAPWHMWGTEAIVDLVNIGPSPQVTFTSQQLAKVAYKRPESWRFFLFSEILSTDIPPSAAILVVRFNLMTGVGRTLHDTKFVTGTGTSQTIQEFVRFEYDVQALRAKNALAKKWVTEVPAPPISDFASTDRTPVSVLVAEDIQCWADCVYVSGTIGDPIRVKVGAFFAPNVHTRPDWQCENFVGELGGR